jgi:hypothetical protein
MTILLAILVVIVVVICALIVGLIIGKLLSPFVVTAYKSLLWKLAKVIENITHSSHEEIKGSKPDISQINNIDYVQDLRQFHGWIDKPVEQGKIAKFHDSCSNNLDDCSLDIPPKPVIESIGNPFTKTVPHADKLSQEKEHVNHKQTEPYFSKRPFQ